MSHAGQAPPQPVAPIVNWYTPPNYRNITYSGEGDVDEFLDKYKALGDTNSWNEASCLEFFPFHLTGTAKDFYTTYKLEHDALHPNDDMDWDALQDEFKSVFSSKLTAEELEANIKAFVKKGDESVQSFYYRLMHLCSRYDKNLEDERKIHFLLKCVTPHMAQEIYATNPKKPKEVLEHLIRAEKLGTIIGAKAEIFRSVPDTTNKEATHLERFLDKFVDLKIAKARADIHQANFAYTPSGRGNERFSGNSFTRYTGSGSRGTFRGGYRSNASRGYLSRKDFPRHNKKFPNTFKPVDNERFPFCTKCNNGYHWFRDCPQPQRSKYKRGFYPYRQRNARASDKDFKGQESTTGTSQ
jgi:hypothetical protein